MRRSTRIDGSAGGEPLSCGNQSTYNRVANAGNLHRLSPFQMPFGILHNLTGKSSLTFSIEKCHFITAICPLSHPAGEIDAAVVTMHCSDARVRYAARASYSGESNPGAAPAPSILRGLILSLRDGVRLFPAP